MPNIVNVAGITGTDGVTPVYDPLARWTTWNLDEIFTGGVGANRYVPKVNDYVEDTSAYITYIVTAIDPVTLIASLAPIDRQVNQGIITTEDVLLGKGDDNYMAYLDTSVTPHILAVDTRLMISGTMSQYAKIFKGSDTSSTGKVISFLYDPQGTFLTNNIPLELAAIDSHVNHAIKVISVAYTNEQLLDGERVTVVIYNAEGHVVSKRQLVVENTSFIRSVNAGQKYISHISVKSPFLSQSDPMVLDYPINVPMQAFNMIGVVHYSDGSTVEMPVDGTKFKMLGIERYVATTVGQRLNLVLSYALAPGEICYGAVSGDGKFAVAPYTLVTANQIGAYTVKLYAYPVWVNDTIGYTLRWFMYNLDRDTSFEVTPYVAFNANGPVFQPKAYGVAQELTARINIRDVSNTFNSYIHVQPITITLKEPGSARQTNWTVAFEPSQTPQYGVNLKARIEMVSGTLTRVRLDSGITSKAEWLNRLYRDTKPLLDRQREVEAPEPNFFVISKNGHRYEFPVDAFRDILSISESFNYNETMIVEFIRRVNGTDILLGCCGLPVYEN